MVAWFSSIGAVTVSFFEITEFELLLLSESIFCIASVAFSLTLELISETSVFSDKLSVSELSELFSDVAFSETTVL